MKWRWRRALSGKLQQDNFVRADKAHRCTAAYCPQAACYMRGDTLGRWRYYCADHAERRLKVAKC